MAYKYDPQVAKQQADLNAANQGKAGYVPLKVDGLLGPLTQGAIQKYGFNTQTGQPNTLPSLKTEEDIRTEPTSNLGNLRLALNTALSEAAQNTSDRRMTELSNFGLLEGDVAPNVLRAAMGLARAGLAQKEEDIFSDVMAGYTEEQKLKQERKKSALDMMNTVIDNGVFADTPAGTLLAWEKEAGLPEGTALAWQAKLKIEQDKSEEAGALQLEGLKLDIAAKKRENKGGQLVKTYTVSKGDTFNTIAQKTGLQAQALIEANPSVDLNNLQPGQVINLPTDTGTIKNMTASTIDPDALNSINASIANGADLQWLYQNFSGVSASLLQSLYYNQ